MQHTTPITGLSRRHFLGMTGGLLALSFAPGCARSSRRAATGLGQIEPDPIALGNRVAEYVAANQLDNVEYPTVCCAYGALRFAKASGNRALEQRVESAYAKYLFGEKAPDHYANGRKLEHRWFGLVPLELGVSRDPRYRTVAIREANLLEAEPAKHASEYYVDHMYGVGTLQAKAFTQLGNAKYATRCVSHLLEHCQVLQRPDGLFHHSERGRPAWGRGNGWAAASMTEALLVLPKGYPRRDELFSAWKRMMEAVIRHQNANGLWHQIVDLPTSWLETSCTAMFVFALATGLRQGWLPAKPYQQATARGWRALTAAVDAQGRLADICIGLGDDPGTVAHYLSCPRKLADKHGQAPLLWAASVVQMLRDMRAIKS